MSTPKQVPKFPSVVVAGRGSVCQSSVLKATIILLHPVTDQNETDQLNPYKLE